MAVNWPQGVEFTFCTSVPNRFVKRVKGNVRFVRKATNELSLSDDEWFVFKLDKDVKGTER